MRSGSSISTAARARAATRSPAAAPIELLPTVLAGRASPRPAGVGDAALARLAQGLDAVLAETAADLGLGVIQAAYPPRLGEGDLPARARADRALVVLPSVSAVAGEADVELRLALAGPSAGSVAVRRARVARADLAVRAVVLLRDLVSPAGIASRPVASPAPPAAGKPPAEKLAGRVTLMTNAAAFGGLVGFSIQAGSGSYDPRLLYPLLIAGAGIGLGASYLASGEWEVGPGDAWYWAAGAWWPAAAGHLIFQGRFAATRADSDRWVFGVLGGGTGVTLATLGLALHPMTEAGAVVAHAGGALGLSLGALVEVAARHRVQQVPFSGMGYGAALGWLAAAAVAVQIRPSWPAARTGAGAGIGSGVPLLGVLGESAATPGRAHGAPIVGVGYAGPFPR